MVKALNIVPKSIGSCGYTPLQSKDHPQKWESLSFFELAISCFFGHEVKYNKLKEPSSQLEKKEQKPKNQIVESEQKTTSFFTAWMSKYSSEFVSYSFTSFREAKVALTSGILTSKGPIRATAIGETAWGFVDLTVVMGGPALKGGTLTPKSHYDMQQSTYKLTNQHTMVIGSKVVLDKIKDILEKNRIGYVSIEELSEKERVLFDVPKEPWPDFSELEKKSRVKV